MFRNNSVDDQLDSITLNVDIIRNFNIERGDLLYGLDCSARDNSEISPRGKNIIFLIDSGMHIDDKTPLKSNRYNDALSKTITNSNLSLKNGIKEKLIKKMIAEKRVIRGGMMQDYISTKRFGQMLSIPEDIEVQVKNYRDFPLWNAYFSAGEQNPKFNVRSIYDEVKNNPNKSQYHQWMGGTDAPAGIAPKLLWKRGSKLCLELSANGSSKHKIHFVLDQINMELVVGKNSEEGQSITASELRYLYRNKERFMGKIHFYKNDIETEAPWETQPWVWENYKVKITSPF
ncbi:hypothetical protein [Serratia marcescens]|uniref:hypothetical protein n=1 Tax=Serratia marcescens TaxID=615 RepID=UPI0012FD0C5E|nr:hypothetical protein [Serratia marcescens]